MGEPVGVLEDGQVGGQHPVGAAQEEPAQRARDDHREPGRRPAGRGLLLPAYRVCRHLALASSRLNLVRL